MVLTGCRERKTDDGEEGAEACILNAVAQHIESIEEGAG